MDNDQGEIPKSLIEAVSLWEDRMAGESDQKPCPECGGVELLVSTFPVGLNFLHGASRIDIPENKVVICRTCGYVRLFADLKVLDQLEKSSYWKRVSS